MQARNHENSDEFRPTPVRHLDLDTPAFYHYRKNPKCYHTVWGINGEVQITYVQKDGLVFFPDGGSSHLSSNNSKEESSPMIGLFLLHPQRLTWSLKTPPWKRKNLYKPPIFGGSMFVIGVRDFHLCCQHRGTRDTFVIPNLPRYWTNQRDFDHLQVQYERMSGQNPTSTCHCFTKTTYPFRARCLSFRFIFTFILAGCTWKHPFLSPQLPCQPSPADHPMCSSESWIFKVTENV